MLFFKHASRITTKDPVISSCALSFVSVSIIRAICKCNNIFIESLLTLFVCLFFAWLAILMMQKKGVRSFLIEHFSFTFAPTVWDDVFDYEEGSIIRVKYKGSNKAVVGVLSSMGNIPDDPWIALSQYWMYPSIEEETISYEEKRTGHYLIININDIEYAELWSNKKEEPA